MRYIFLTAAGILAVFSATFAFQPASSNTEQRAMLDKYCVTCHNQRLKTGGLTLDTLNLEKVADNAETWEKVLRKLHGGMMPPQGMPRPDEATVNQFTWWLETSLDRAAATHPEPGRSTLHRLNRTEYGNAIHDLLDLDIDAASLLPADDEANGFDNIAARTVPLGIGQDREPGGGRPVHHSHQSGVSGSARSGPGASH